MESAIKNTRVQFPLADGLTKTEVAQMADAAVAQVVSKGNFFQVAEVISAMEEFTDKVRKDPRFVDGLLEELNKFPQGKLTTPSGAKLEACETGVKYDYSHNEAWAELEGQIKELTEKRKAIEDKLKKIPAGKLLVDESTGEAWIGAPKTSKTNYKLTLAK
jgi:hypothetical protein